jgi:hypothetical protein
MQGSARWLAAAIALAVGGLAGAILPPAVAEARVDAESGYTKNQTYSGALRYLRLDLGYEVVEKDPEAAYLLFKYAAPGDNKRVLNGTVEVVETEGKVRLFVRIPQMPEYHERVLRDGLLKKLREEYGAPPPKKAAKPAPKPPADAGTG